MVLQRLPVMEIAIPYAYHRECFLKLVRTGKWKKL
jgi:hypothetical protein